MRVLLVVACALIDEQGRVLLAQRPAGRSFAGLYELPGGKIDTEETPEQAIVRELHEELGINIDPSFLEALTFVSYDYGDFHLLMLVYVCRQWSGVVQPMEGQDLSWVAQENLSDWDMLPANTSIVERLLNRLSI
ncbi:MAG: 8-oxo-dGTP diphosphatase MutT [Parvularculales bacterium]